MANPSQNKSDQIRKNKIIVTARVAVQILGCSCSLNNLLDIGQLTNINQAYVSTLLSWPVFID
jgi:hypothetical protein